MSILLKVQLTTVQLWYFYNILLLYTINKKKVNMLKYAKLYLLSIVNDTNILTKKLIILVFSFTLNIIINFKKI